MLRHRNGSVNFGELGVLALRLAALGGVAAAVGALVSLTG